MSCTLLVEVGGTYTRCALTSGDIGAVQVFINTDHMNLASVLRRYYEKLPGASPSAALIAIAAPVTAERVHLTNLNWEVDGAELADEFALERVRLVNDFAALACAIPHLPRKDLLVLHKGRSDSNQHNIAVMGPGTGLGVSGLVRCGNEWHPVSGEGGHVTLAAAAEREEVVIGRLRARFGHVSAERALSGRGLVNLYQALNDGSAVKAPEDVTRLAQQGDGAAMEALDLFFKFLGTVAADLALTLGARGGLYLGGGILPAIKQQLQNSQFISRFRAKGRYSDYLSAIPVCLIIADNPALLGLNNYPDS